MTRRYLELTTAHMPSDAPDFGDTQVVEHDTGYVVFVGELTGVEPEWFAPVLALARAEGLFLIVFDRDADEIPNLPTYEW